MLFSRAKRAVFPLPVLAPNSGTPNRSANHSFSSFIAAQVTKDDTRDASRVVVCETCAQISAVRAENFVWSHRSPCRSHVTMLHALWLGEITIRQPHARSEYEYGAVTCGLDSGLRFLGQHPVSRDLWWAWVEATFAIWSTTASGPWFLQNKLAISPAGGIND
jgi:hypothetical protein